MRSLRGAPRQGFASDGCTACAPGYYAFGATCLPVPASVLAASFTAGSNATGDPRGAGGGVTALSAAVTIKSLAVAAAPAAAAAPAVAAALVRRGARVRPVDPRL